jgi:hypothetical protein
MLRFLPLLFGLFLLAPVSAPGSAYAETRAARCLLEIDGRTIIDGVCPFVPQAGGDFSIGDDEGPIGFFALVQIESPGLARGYWNGEQYATHAHSSLGWLERNDACWENERARVCAW